MLALVFALTVLATPPVVAQDAPDEESELELLFNHPEVVSGASKSDAPEDLRDTPAVVTVITADQLKAWGVHTLADVLAMVPESYVTGDDSYLLAGIRGVAQDQTYNERMLLLLDGHVISEPFDDYAPIGSDFPIDFSLVERVEIISGPVSALYGSNAFFGAVNVVTRTANGRVGRVSAEGGSVFYARGTASTGNGVAPDVARATGGEHWHYEVAATFNALEGERYDLGTTYLAPGEYGTAPKTELNRDRNGSLYARGGIGNLTVFANLIYRRKYTSAAGDADPTTNGFPFNEDKHILLDAQYGILTSGPFRLRVRAYADGYGFDQNNPVDGVPFSGDGFHARSEWGGLETVGEWTAGPSSMLGSAELSHDDLRDHSNNVGQRYYLSRGTVQERYRLGTWGLALAGAYAEQSAPHGFDLAPRASLIVHPWKSTTLKAIYGRGFRHPTIYELYNATLDPGLGKLDPELVDSYEVEAQQQISWPVEVFADAFHMHAHRLIIYGTNGVYSNAGSVDDDGATAGVRVHFPFVQARADATVFHIRDQDGNRLQGSADWIAHLTAVVPIDGGRFAASARVGLVGPKLDDFLEKQKAYATVDASLVASHVWRGLGVTFLGTNLTDVRTGTLNATHAFDMPRRRVFLSASWEW